MAAWVEKCKLRSKPGHAPAAAAAKQEAAAVSATAIKAVGDSV
jgi:hypothetical protein